MAMPSGLVMDEGFVIRVAIFNHRSQPEDFALLIREVVRLGEEYVGL